MKRLTKKQQLFVNNYRGSATEAALAAGYSPRSAAVAGCENLKNPNILEHLRAEGNNPNIATRQERQEFFTATMRDNNLFPKDRLKAAELLGKMSGDFIDKVEHIGNIEPIVINVAFVTNNEH